MTIKEYNALSHFDKQKCCEDLLKKEIPLNDKIKLSYQDALNYFHLCVMQNEKLALAFQNYLENKKIELNNVPKRDILIYSAVDKIKNKLLFFIKKEEDVRYSLLEFDVKDEKFTESDRPSFTINFKGHDIECISILDRNNKFFKISWDKKLDTNIGNLWNHSFLEVSDGQELIIYHPLGYLDSHEKDGSKMQLKEKIDELTKSLYSTIMPVDLSSRMNLVKNAKSKI